MSLVALKWFGRYSYGVAAKSAAGIGTPNYQTTHSTRQRVFLCVKPAHAKIMAAQVGQLNSWPVSFGTGSSNPIWAATL